MHPASRRALSLSLILFLLLLFIPMALAQDIIMESLQPPPFFEGEPLLEVYFISVGVGDAFLLKSGQETMLIDGGHQFKSQRLKDFMKDHGISGVTAILNTHWHDDHITGMMSLLRSGFTAERFYSPYPYGFKHEFSGKLYPLLEKGGIAYETVGRGDVLTLGAAQLHVFRDSQVQHDANARSLVIKVVCGERTLLLMADAGGVAQRDLVQTVGEGLKADVIKVPHHGIIPNLPDFLDMVGAKAAIVTNKQKSVPRTDKQLEQRGILRYFTCYRPVYLATDGKVWHIYQGE